LFLTCSANVFCFSQLQSPLGPSNSLHSPSPVPTLKLHEISIFSSPTRPEVVSVLSHLSLPRYSSKRVDPPGYLCIRSACITLSLLKCSILNVSSHEFSVAHRKAGQTLTWYYTPGSRIGLRPSKLQGRKQRPSPQHGSGLRSRRTFPTLLAEPVRCILSLLDFALVVADVVILLE